MNMSLTVRFDKNWELENGEKKKIGILTFQKLAKTGNIGEITSFNRCFNLESIILGYYFLTRSGYLSVFLIPCDIMLM